MNPKFKELAKAAGLKQTKWADVETGVEPVRIWQESLNDPGALERFAELILEEVMQELFINGYEDAFDFLNKHFGIENDQSN